MKDVNKAAWVQIKEVVNASEVLLVVLDARDPQRCKSKRLERLVQQANKRIVFVLNKIDLVSRRNAEGWVKNLSQEYPVAVTVSTNSTAEHLAAAAGVEELANLLTHFALETKKKLITVGVVGYASVGRSDISIGGPIELLLRSKIITNESLVSATESIVMRCKKEPLMVNYSLPMFDNGNEFLCQLARQQGNLLKGGIPDTITAARSFLRELINIDKLPFYTTPPRPRPHPSSSSDSKSLSNSGSVRMKEFGTSVKKSIEMLDGLLFPMDSKPAIALAPQELLEDDEDQEEEDNENQEEEEDDEAQEEEEEEEDEEEEDT
ncbi:Guanine nucleotide-binding protein-like 3-like protein [Modicella reniformis]|uniref:Guanine nucleotide-binding protein-like 3-like protein n=1 Tax=Modicella reniformis TaxID=1440133 RepID=A0A9P6IJG6_9FUNG|nr:Guanine nucleotide-binding protein-like 3-like protein [Modicella reniformis]